MAEQQEFLEDGSPLIKAAELGKMRLVRLLVEGGAQVNERNQRGETPLIATCRAFRADMSGNSTSLRLIRFLLQHHADPNAQDKSGRTALMYACMERAGAEVVTDLISAGADPSLEDYAGGSALVYGINARDQDTICLLLDACKAMGRDIIIISTDLNTGDASVSRRYLKVPPSPDTSPVACMSPSEIELKTGSPNSESEGIFNFSASGTKGSRAPSPLLLEPEASDRQLQISEPWLAIHNLAHVSHTYEERKRTEAVQEEEDKDAKHCSSNLQAQQADRSNFCKVADLKPGRAFCRNHNENISPSAQAILHNRRNTLPALPGHHVLQLPTLSLHLSSSDTHLHDQPSTLTLPPVPINKNLQQSSSYSGSHCLAPSSAQCRFSSLRKWKVQELTCLKPQVCSSTSLPPLAVSCTVNTGSSGDRRHQRRHSIQLEQMRQEGSNDEIL